MINYLKSKAKAIRKALKAFDKLQKKERKMASPTAPKTQYVKKPVVKKTAGKVAKKK